MKKYKLINKTTKKETICTKVNVNGFDYYVSKQEINSLDWYYLKQVSDIGTPTGIYQASDKPKVNKLNSLAENILKVTCTSNPNIDLPKIIDEVEYLSKNAAYKKHSLKDDRLSLDEQIQRSGGFIVGFKEGYNKRKETNPFSEEDMLSFGLFCAKFVRTDENTEDKSRKELLELWKEGKVEIIYFE